MQGIDDYARCSPFNPSFPRKRESRATGVAFWTLDSRFRGNDDGIFGMIEELVFAGPRSVLAFRDSSDCSKPLPQRDSRNETFHSEPLVMTPLTAAIDRAFGLRRAHTDRSNFATSLLIAKKGDFPVFDPRNREFRA